MAQGDKVYLADKETLDAINTKIGTAVDTGGTATAGSTMAKLNALLSNGGGGIKSIQYGVVETDTRLITISEVDLDKTIAIVNGYTSAGGEAGSQPLYIAAMTSTSIKVSGASGKKNYGSYQVVEFN